MIFSKSVRNKRKESLIINIVIIGQNEGKHIQNMLASLLPYDYRRILFPEHLEQWWGAEDTGCGDECYRIGLTCDISTDIKLNGVMEHKDVCQDAQKARLDNLMRIWEMQIWFYG